MIDFFTGENGEDLTKSDGNYSQPEKQISFFEYVAKKYSSPEHIYADFKHDAAIAAQSVGVTLPDIIDFSIGKSYATNIDGKNDKRQGYFAEIIKRNDGVSVPIITFNSFRHGGQSAQWNPGDALWNEYNSYKNSGGSDAKLTHNPEKYRIRAEEIYVERERKKKNAEKLDKLGADAVAISAINAFDAASTNKAHDYLSYKNVSHHGARVAEKHISGLLYDSNEKKIFNGTICNQGDLLIPIYKNGEIVTLQRIDSSGNKKFLSGGSTSSGYYVIDGDDKLQALIAEGFATGASVAEATGRRVFIAFSAHNLKNVSNDHICIGAVAADSGDAGIKCAEDTGLPYLAPESGDWNDYAKTHGIDALSREFENLEYQTSRNKHTEMMDGWLLADIAKPANYLVDGLLEEDAHGILGGASMTFKSFFALRLAHSICSGLPFMGRKVYRTGSVVYVCGEGQNAVARRLRALKIHLGDEIEHSINIIGSTVSLTNQLSMASLAMQLKDIKPVLVIFDTFASLSGGIEENSNSEVGLALNLIRDTCRFAGASSMIIHHFGKDAEKGFRGASAFVNNVDYAFVAKRAEGGMEASVTCNKMKDGDHFDEIMFKAQAIKLGIFDQNGEESTSLIVESSQKETSKMSQIDLMLWILKRLQKKAKCEVHHITGAEWDKAAHQEGIKNPRQVRPKLVDMGLVEEVGRGKFWAI